MRSLEQELLVFSIAISGSNKKQCLHQFDDAVGERIKIACGGNSFTIEEEQSEGAAEAISI